jgi:hypothetical protein
VARKKKKVEEEDEDEEGHAQWQSALSQLGETARGLLLPHEDSRGAQDDQG